MKIKLEKGAYMPERSHSTDAGLDLKCMERFTLIGMQGKTVRTGVHVQLPKGTAGLLVSKSGLNTKYDITSTGLVDEGFSGEIMVKMYNHGPFSYTFEAGDKISQLVVMPVRYEDVEIVDEIEAGERGTNGYGSTGR